MWRELTFWRRRQSCKKLKPVDWRLHTILILYPRNGCHTTYRCPLPDPSTIQKTRTDEAFTRHWSIISYYVKLIIHSVFVTRDSCGGSSDSWWQAAAPAWKRTSDRPAQDFRVKKTVWIMGLLWSCMTVLGAGQIAPINTINPIIVSLYSTEIVTWMLLVYGMCNYGVYFNVPNLFASRVLPASSDLILFCRSAGRDL